jgi:hypothetical protein
MRRFFLVWQERVQIFQQPAEKLAANQIFQSPSGKSRGPFTLSWTHYVLLLTIKDPD